MKEWEKKLKKISLKGKRIIHMDDEPINIEFFSVMLSKTGADYKGTTDAEIALQLVKQNPPDLFITDIVHPGPSGHEMLQILKQDEKTKSVPIIIFSAMLENKRDKEEVINNGAAAAIGMPYEFWNVFRVICKVLKIGNSVSESNELKISEPSARHEALPGLP